MNLFVVGWTSAGTVPTHVAERALRDLLERLPFFPDAPVATWTASSGSAAFAAVSHGAERTGGVRYRHDDRDGFALFSGRPIRWTDDHEADGRAPLDPARLRLPAERWAQHHDGRWAAVRYHEPTRELQVATDALGAYPLFCAQADGVRWHSNSAELLRTVVGSSQLEPAAMAGLLGAGWPLEGQPVWLGVRRLPPGVTTLRPDRAPAHAPLLGAEELVRLPGEGFDPDAAARVLVTGCAALADWPGRDNVVPLTGGRDSRLVLAAALRAGFAFRTVTGGAPEHPDVRLGRLLAETVERPHALLDADPHGDPYATPQRAADVLALTSAGTVSLGDAAGFPLGPRGHDLPLTHSGQGGEVARAYYGIEEAQPGRVAERLVRALLARRPFRPEIVNGDAVALVEDQVRGWVDERVALGASPRDLPDLFYLERRMGTWAGPTHGCVEYVRDTTSPLWSRRLVAHQLGLPGPARALETFHLELLRRLAPELVDLPFEGGREWPRLRGPAARRALRARELAGKAAGRARRRLPAAGARATAPLRRGRGPGGPPHEAAAPTVVPVDPLAPVLALVRERVLSNPGHAAWSVLDRGRVERLLGRDAAALDTMERYHVWRLATLFLPAAYAATTARRPSDGEGAVRPSRDTTVSG